MAAVALSVWIVILLKFVTGGNKWVWILYTLIPGSGLTIVVTALLGRFWVARKTLPSYGTLIGVPFCCVYLVWAFRYFKSVGWKMFTADYWDHMNGTLTGRLFDQGLIGAICVLPAIAVVMFYHNRSKTHDPKSLSEKA